jgi:hypothetical protein
VALTSSRRAIANQDQSRFRLDLTLLVAGLYLLATALWS